MSALAGRLVVTDTGAVYQLAPPARLDRLHGRHTGVVQRTGRTRVRNMMPVAARSTLLSVSAVTHLNFRGDARSALGFYHSVFGGDLMIITNQEMGIVEVPAELDQVKWGQVAAANGFKVMAYDVPAAQPWSRGTDSFFLSLRGESTDEIAALWEKLAVGSTVAVPLAPAPWAPLYGMLTDPYGITWVVDVMAQNPAS